MATFLLLYLIGFVCFADCAKFSSYIDTVDLEINENDNGYKEDGIPQELRDYIDKRLSENDERHKNEINELKQHLNRQDYKIERLELEVEDLRSRCEHDERSTWNDENTSSPQTTESTTGDDMNSTESVVVPISTNRHSKGIDVAIRNRSPKYRMLLPYNINMFNITNKLRLPVPTKT